MSEEAVSGAGTLHATFRSEADALAAREALLAASPGATVTGPTLVTDSGFIVRFLIIVAIASIVGTALGAAIGLGFIAAGITPDTTESLVLQTVTWAIFWHLLIGMIAGYVLLADRSQNEWRPGKKAALTVTCADPESIRGLEDALRSAGAVSLDVR